MLYNTRIKLLTNSPKWVYEVYYWMVYGKPMRLNRILAFIQLTDIRLLMYYFS